MAYGGRAGDSKDSCDSGDGMEKELEKAMNSFMYVHPVRDRKKENIAVMIALSATLFMVPVVAALFVTPATIVSAQNSGLKIMSGTITDSMGSPVVGANVNVSMYDATTSVWVSSLLYTTLSSGFYTVTFGGMGGAAWEIGDRVVATATLGPDTGSNEAIADAEPVQTIDVTMGAVIPEFSAPIGVTGAAVFVCLLFFVTRGRRSRMQGV